MEIIRKLKKFDNYFVNPNFCHTFTPLVIYLMFQKDYITLPSVRAFSPYGVDDKSRIVGGLLFDMPKFIDLTGQRFYRLTVASIHSRTPSKWNVVCDCGNRRVVDTRHLRDGHTKSCGCYAKDRRIAKATRHNMSKTPPHNAWQEMIMRCTNKNNKCYRYYGGRGISVCDRWVECFENFYADMGPRPSKLHSLDRIDNNGNYEPSNCRWATKLEQARNKRNTVFCTDGDLTMVIAEWANHLNISYDMVKYYSKKPNNKYNLKRVTK